MNSIGKYARQIAAELRRNPTKAEAALWTRIRNKQFYGLKFLFQHPIFYKENQKRKFFIADFYCAQIKLIIEIDGDIHKKQIIYDNIRTEIICQKNITVIRFLNKDILDNINHVLIYLKRKIDSL
ncbi:MAG: endonuclease domain-containing protein [Calditrichaceae bacterium]